MSSHEPTSIQTRFLQLPATTVSAPVTRQTGPLDKALPWVIEFRVVGTSSIIQAQVRDEMLIGRMDKERGILPDVDLTEYNAGLLGVSRQHAQIIVRNQQLWIRDMGSTNGTRLNHGVLEPLTEARLRHGDEVMMGGLHLQIQFAVVPAQQANKTHPSSMLHDLTIPTIGRGQRVLVIEDDFKVGEVFRSSLENAGFKVTLVQNTTQGLGIVFHQMPDAIIVDMMSADLNALDLVRYVRKQSNGAKRIPVVVVSSANGGFYKSQAYQAGADVFMGKPVAVEELVRAVGASARV